MKVCFTMDIDWAPDHVIEYSLDLFSKNNIPCTIFATHKTDVLKGIGPNFEVGIHPNFNPLLSGEGKDSASDVIDRVLEIFPESKGVRSHSITQSSQLLNIFVQKNLVYDSNNFLPYQPIKVYKSWNGLYRIPYNWEDDVHFEYGYSFEDLRMDDVHDFAVLDFHPIHLFLNTENSKRYSMAKEYLKDKNSLESFRNTEISGSQDGLFNAFNKYKQFKPVLMKQLIEGIS